MVIFVWEGVRGRRQQMHVLRYSLLACGSNHHALSLWPYSAPDRCMGCTCYIAASCFHTARIMSTTAAQQQTYHSCAACCCCCCCCCCPLQVSSEFAAVLEGFGFTVNSMGGETRLDLATYNFTGEQSLWLCCQCQQCVVPLLDCPPPSPCWCPIPCGWFC